MESLCTRFQVTLESWEPRASLWYPDLHQEQKILFEEGEIKRGKCGETHAGDREGT